MLQSEDAGLAKVVHVQEFTQRRAGAPARHRWGLGGRRLVEATDQGRQHMAVFGVVVVARPIQIGGQLLRRRLRLQTDRIEAVLQAQRLAELDTGDLGDRIPLVGGLQGPAEQGLFTNRLLGEFRIDAAAAQKQQPPHARAPGRFDHMGLDLEVVEQEIGWIAVVGLDAAHLRRGEHHHRGLVLAKPALNRSAIEQVQLGPRCGEQGAVAGTLQRPADGPAGHAAVASHEEAVGRGDHAVAVVMPSSRRSGPPAAHEPRARGAARGAAPDPPAREGKDHPRRSAAANDHCG